MVDSGYNGGDTDKSKEEKSRPQRAGQRAPEGGRGHGRQRLKMVSEPDFRLIRESRVRPLTRVRGILRCGRLL